MILTLEENDIELDDGEIVTNIRHMGQIDEAIRSLNEVKNTIKNHMPIDITEIYLKQATGKEFDSTNYLAKLYCKCLVYEWFRYKGVMGDKTVSDKTKYTLQGIALQLKYT